MLALTMETRARTACANHERRHMLNIGSVPSGVREVSIVAYGHVTMTSAAARIAMTTGPSYVRIRLVVMPGSARRRRTPRGRGRMATSETCRDRRRMAAAQDDGP